MKRLSNQIFLGNNDGRKVDLDVRATLRKSTRPRLRETIKRRLDELVILEITQEGGRQYFQISVRELYNHILKAITRLPLSSQSALETVMPLHQSHRRASLSPEGSIIIEGLPNGQSEAIEQIQNNLLLSHGDVTQHRSDVTYRERLGAHLHPRDLRRLVTPFSLGNEPELIVRRHVMLLNFDPLRAIILRDRLLVLVPDGADSLLETIEKRVRGGETGVENDLFGESPGDVVDASSKADSEHEAFLSTKPANPSATAQAVPSPLVILISENGRNTSSEQFGRDEFDELQTTTWRNLPFELQCLDAVLHGVTDMLSFQATDTLKETLASMDYLLRPDTGVGTFAQEMLRTSKNNINTMVSRVNGFVRALTLVLNEDEDMALMNLSRLISHPERFIQPVSAHILEEESDEPELLLEAYLQQALTLTNELESMKGQLQTTEGFMNMKSDTIRNRILFVNMISIATMMAITMSLLVTGVFAMNVPVYLYEGDEGLYFRPLVISLACGPFVIVVAILYLLRRGGILTSVV